MLEETPGLVLATFSGHDHAPLPPYTHEALGTPFPHLAPPPLLNHHPYTSRGLHTLFTPFAVLSPLVGKPAYLTMAATVEGSWPTHNAYSRVSILADCTVRVHGFGSGGYNVSVPPPDATCSLE